MVQLAGVTSVVPYCKLEFGSSRHRGASFTVALWLLRVRKQAQLAERGEGREEGGDEWECEGEISSLRMKVGGGGGGAEMERDISEWPCW